VSTRNLDFTSRFPVYSARLTPGTLARHEIRQHSNPQPAEAPFDIAPPPYLAVTRTLMNLGVRIAAELIAVASLAVIARAIWVYRKSLTRPTAGGIVTRLDVEAHKGR
jgi:hypothetical protein